MGIGKNINIGISNSDLSQSNMLGVDHNSQTQALFQGELPLLSLIRLSIYDVISL